jgi:hypothetical protein
MDPWQMALDAMFNGPGSQAAVFVQDAEADVPVRIIRRGPDRLSRFGDTMILPDQHPIDVRKSEAAAPAVGDGFLLDGVMFAITVDPILDVEGLTWTCGVERQP